MNAKAKFDVLLASVENFLEFLLCAVILFVFFVALNFESYPVKHSYFLGDVALRDIRAPVGFSAEDVSENENLKFKVLSQVPLVYDLDSSVQNRISSRINDVFKHYRDFQKGIKSEEKEVSIKGQQENVNQNINFQSLWFCTGTGSYTRELFSKELGINVTQGEYKILVEYEFDEFISQLINSIIGRILSGGVVSDKEKILHDLSKRVVIRNLSGAFEKRIGDLKDLYDITQAKSMVRVLGGPLLGELDSSLLNLIVDFSKALIEVNLTFNSEESNRRKSLALKSFIPKFQFVKSGDVILKKGEIVTRNHLSKLKTLNNKVRVDQSSEFGLVAILFVALATYYLTYLSPKIKSKKIVSKDLIFLTTIMLANMLIVRFWSVFDSVSFFGLSLTEIGSSNIKFGIPLAAGSMIICLVLGMKTAFSFSFLSSLACSMLLPYKFEYCICMSLSCVLAVWWVRNCRERSDIIKAATKFGLFCAVMAVVMNHTLLKCSLWYFLTFDAIVAFLSGISVGIIVVGVLPIIEIVFRYTTDISLLELANLDRPILRKLMLEAPGTYHHSVVVGTMVEAAASEIGVNPLLGKVCGYYHDIGKLKQPLYFVENQLHRRNKHDKLSPSMSSLVLISHVKHGVEIARKHNLDSSIIDVIEQHHGSSLISYFFEKAKQTKGEDNINVNNFRYPGPIPQTVVAGLVMLADVVEAASRALVNPTSSRIQGLVQDLVNKVFSDGQLNHCDLTLKDLNSIAKSFNKILTGIYHHRVEYQNYTHATTIDWRAGDASANKKYSESSSDANKKNFSNSTNTLKRLGLS